jgi:uroporphyrinogen decarboxylase
MVFTRGFFQSVAVGDWRTLEPLMYAMVDRPDEVEAGMAASADVSLWAIDTVASRVDLDFAILSEPIASFHAPVISPGHYRRLALPHYRRMIDRLRSAGVDVIVTQAFGQVKALLPLWLDIGVNAFWCSHTVPAGMDYLEIRRDFGSGLRLIGGIDALALTGSRADIDRAIDRTVPSLLSGGGYLPLLDDRVRPEVPYGNYVYYRERLERSVA